LINSIIPQQNIDAYKFLFAIETGLRELIIEKLSSKAGIKWYKSRLPGDVLGKYKDAIKFEKSISWISLIPHHPIYYIDFPDLRKVIEKSDNWKDCFEPIFIRKDNISGTLTDIEMIRNKIAHNRVISDNDLLILQSSYNKIINAIGDESFLKSASKCTMAFDIIKILKKLREESYFIYSQIQEYALLTETVEWPKIKESWWFDESYLGSNINYIEVFFENVKEYKNFPRVRGEGYKLENWLKHNQIDEKFKLAIEQLDILITEGENINVK
jgi:hypothetical protein